VDTIGALPLAGRRRRRLHSDEFKADAVAAASQPGISMASVALARGINAKLLRRWVREAEMPPTKMLAKAVPAASTFVAVQLSEPLAPAGEIRIKVRRGAARRRSRWPGRWLRLPSAQAACASCCGDPHQGSVAGCAAAGNARRHRVGLGPRHHRKRAGNTPRELEVDQSKAPGCQRCGSNSSIRPAGCVGNRASTSLM
jgi:transposase